MPNVTGKTEAEATAQLRSLGLRVQTVQVPGSTGNRVVGQEPEPDTTVKQGQTVKIYLAN
jgi:beta-lactam-binding protein with PASTA domain